MYIHTIIVIAIFFKTRIVLGVPELEAVKDPNPGLLTPKYTYFPSPHSRKQPDKDQSKTPKPETESHLTPNSSLNLLTWMPVVWPCQA